MIVFLFLYTFSIPVFSGVGKTRFIPYFLMAFFAGLTIFYSIFFTKFRFNRWLLLPFSFVLFASIGTTIYSHNFRMWLTLVLMLVTMFAFYYSFVAIDKKRLIFKVVLFAFLAFGFYFAFIYKDSILHFRLSSTRLGGDFDNVNAIGFYFAIAFTLSLYISLFYKRKLELLYLLSAIFFFALGLFTGSRAFLISVLGSGLVILFFKLKKHLFIFFAIVTTFIGIFIIIVNTDIQGLGFLKEQFERTLYTLFGIGQSKVDTSTIQRVLWRDYGYYLGEKNLLIGYGCDGFSVYSGIGTYSHNNFAEVICDFGLIGFVLFFSCYLIPIVLTIGSKESELKLVPILFTVYFFRNLFGVTYYSKEAYLIIALLFYLTRNCKIPIIGNKKNASKFVCEVSI